MRCSAQKSVTHFLLPQLLADIASNRGGILSQQSRFEESIVCYLEAHSRTKTLLGSSDERSVRTLINVGLAYDRAGDADRGLECFQQAANTMKKTGATKTLLYAHSQRYIGASLIRSSKFEDALGNFELTLPVYRIFCLQIATNLLVCFN